MAVTTKMVRESVSQRPDCSNKRFVCPDFAIPSSPLPDTASRHVRSRLLRATGPEIEAVCLSLVAR